MLKVKMTAVVMIVLEAHLNGKILRRPSSRVKGSVVAC